MHGRVHGIGHGVSALGLGCGRIGSFNNPASAAQTAYLLERALDLGVSLLDTADVYGQGDSERAVGRLPRASRERAFVVTKAGYLFSRRMRLLRPLKPLLKPLIARSAAGRARMTAMRGGTMAQDFSPGHLVAAVDASLRRLRTDRIDAFLLHDPPTAVLRDPAVAATLARLASAGKIGRYGVSCGDATEPREALRLPGASVVEATPAMLDGIGAPERQAFAGLILAREVVRHRGSLTPAQAVARVVDRGDVDCAVVGTTSVTHLEEIVTAVADRSRRGASRHRCQGAMAGRQPAPRDAPR